MVMESSGIRRLRHTLTLPNTAKQATVERNKEQEQCPLDKLQVRVVEKVGNTVVAERYIQPAVKQLNKHRLLKQASLEKRRNKRSPGSKSDL